MEQRLANRRNRTKVQKIREKGIGLLLFACVLISVATTMAIVVILFKESLGFFEHVSLTEFFGSKTWTPLFSPQNFGVWPLVSGTVLVAGIAMLIATPLGVAGAIFLSEYAKDAVRKALKPTLEVLAGIPTVVYGYFALMFVTPLLRHIVPNMDIFNALSAGVVMGIMILPIVTSLSEDAMIAVPRTLRMGAYALGATRFEVARRIVVPAALSGISASFILAFSRAVGETMLVTIAAGATPKFTLDPTESIQTITAYIAQISLGETPHGTVEYQTIFAVALVLFCMTLAMNLLSQWLVRKWREKYE